MITVVICSPAARRSEFRSTRPAALSRRARNTVGASCDMPELFTWLLQSIAQSPASRRPHPLPRVPSIPACIPRGAHRGCRAHSHGRPCRAGGLGGRLLAARPLYRRNGKAELRRPWRAILYTRRPSLSLAAAVPHLARFPRRCRVRAAAGKAAVANPAYRPDHGTYWWHYGRRIWRPRPAARVRRQDGQ